MAELYACAISELGGSFNTEMENIYNEIKEKYRADNNSENYDVFDEYIYELACKKIDNGQSYLPIIHNEIKKGTYPSTKKLRDKCRKEFNCEKLSTATLSRDIAFLRDRFRAPIEYEPSIKGYFYSTDFELKF